MKIAYSVEQDTFIIMSCYRNGTFVNEECVFSVTACKQECLAKYRDLIIQETSLEAHITDVIDIFVRTSSVDKRKSPGRPSVSEEVVDDLRRLEQNTQTSLTSSQVFLLQHEIEQWVQNIDEKKVKMCL